MIHDISKSPSGSINAEFHRLGFICIKHGNSRTYSRNEESYRAAGPASDYICEVIERLSQEHLLEINNNGIN